MFQGKDLNDFLSAFLFGLFAVWGRMRRIQWTSFCIVAPGYWLMASLTIAFTICLASPGSKGFEIYSSITRASVYQQLPKSITCIPPHIPPYTTNIPPYTTPHTTVYHPTYHRIPPHIPPYTTNIPPYTTPHTTVYHPYTTNYQKLPKNYQKLPKTTKNYKKLPKNYQKLPKTTKNYQNLRKPSNSSICWMKARLSKSWDAPCAKCLLFTLLLYGFSFSNQTYCGDNRFLFQSILMRS